MNPHTGLSPGAAASDDGKERARAIARLLAARDHAGALVLADELVADRRGLIADDLALRAACHLAAGAHAAAHADLAAALNLDPTLPAVNGLLLAHGDAQQRAAAAFRLLDPRIGRTPEAALGHLAREGIAATGAFTAEPEGTRGWCAWNGAANMRLDLRFDDGATSLVLPMRAVAAPFAYFASVFIPWPEVARGLHLSAEAESALFAGHHLIRPLTPPPLAAGALTDLSSRRLAVIVPVYGDLAATAACLDALARDCAEDRGLRVIAIDDAAPVAALSADLAARAARGTLHLIRHHFNLGFAASVNDGLACLAPDEDALVLNADALPPPGAGRRLQRAAWREMGVGTATPLSNNGEYTSLPMRFVENPMPAPGDIARLDEAARRANGDGVVDVPNGIGFCLFIKRNVLETIGLFSTRFGRGYGEDIEFSLRAASAGFRNVCATGVYVGHHGGRSFGTDKRALVVRHLATIARTHPAYRAHSHAFVAADPLREAIERLLDHRARSGDARHLKI